MQMLGKATGIGMGIWHSIAPHLLPQNLWIGLLLWNENNSRGKRLHIIFFDLLVLSGQDSQGYLFYRVRNGVNIMCSGYRCMGKSAYICKTIHHNLYNLFTAYATTMFQYIFVCIYIYIYHVYFIYIYIIIYIYIYHSCENFMACFSPSTERQ